MQRQQCAVFWYNNKRFHYFQRHQKIAQFCQERLQQVTQELFSLNKMLLKRKSNMNCNPLAISSYTSTELPRRILSTAFINDDFVLSEKIIIKKLDKLSKNATDEEVLTEKRMGILGKRGRLFIWLDKKVNKLLFFNPEEMQDIHIKLESGLEDIPSFLEDELREAANLSVQLEIMKLKLELIECKIIKEETKKGENEEIYVKTKELNKAVTRKIDGISKKLTCCSWIKLICETLFKMLLSSTQILCYILMILAHVFNDSLLSVIYPTSIFGYAILASCRPSRMYWKIMLIYSLMLILLKYILSELETLGIIDLNAWVEDVANVCFFFHTTSQYSFLARVSTRDSVILRIYFKLLCSLFYL